MNDSIKAARFCVEIAEKSETTTAIDIALVYAVIGLAEILESVITGPATKELPPHIRVLGYNNQRHFQVISSLLRRKETGE